MFPKEREKCALSEKTRIAVFASGNGSNFQALVDACESGEIKGEVVALVTTQRHAYAATRARMHKIDVLFFEPEKYNSRTTMCSKMAKALHEKNVELVCLAGYMLKLEPCMVRSFPNRILNIHPALLPKFGGQGMYGKRVHEAVIAAGESESGCTIHLVDEIYDNGPVLAQAKVPVQPNDTPETLAERIHAQEHALYVSVVKRICSGEINLDEIASKRITA